MKLLDRHNIFDLIGKDRRKYHSALITCYSYDFSFFEERILPGLRTANIKNVNVFTDGRFLENVLEHTTGKEFRANKTYTLTSVYPKGIFHPKIMLLLGSKQGLLIVGSGNLTGGGICSNDEIWGAFHLSANECQHASLFAEAWNYFLSLKMHVRGFVNQSFNWINKYSPWINDLMYTPASWCDLNDNEKIYFLYNTEKRGILNQLTTLIPKKNLEALTIISPYYDLNGKLLDDLNTLFKPALINAVVNSEFGSVPAKIDKDISIKFFEWDTVMENACRLHAKLFHFRFSDKEQYLLFGSANASVAAFGSVQTSGRNEEVCLLMKKNSNVSYLQELNIKLPKKNISVSDWSGLQTSNNVNGVNKEIRITYVELEGKKLTLHFEKEVTKNLQLIVVDTDGEELENKKINLKGFEATLNISSIDAAFKVAIHDNIERVSNYQLIHRVEYLIKNNPDPQQEKLDGLIEDLLSGNKDGIADLFNHLSYNWADEDETQTASVVIANGGNKEKSKVNGQYTKLDESQFNEISREVLLKQSGILSSTSLKIAEFLGILSGNLRDAEKEDFEESEETRQLNEGNSGEGDQIKRKLRIKSDGEKEQRAINYFFWKLSNSYTALLENFYHTKGVEAPNQLVSIKSLSNILIALEVFNIYYGKKYQTEEITNDGNVIVKDNEYIYEGSISGYYDDSYNAIWFLLDVLGKFLLLAVAGHRKYDYELLTNKQKEMQWNIFSKSLLAIFNVGWTERMYGYRDTLLLNLLFLINPEDCRDDKFVDRLSNQINSFKNKAHKIHPNFSINKDYFFISLLPKYKSWFNLYSDTSLKANLILLLSDLPMPALIYKRNFGFAQLKRIRKASDTLNHLSLIASGFEWDDDEECCLLKDMPNANKVVCFR